MLKKYEIVRKALCCTSSDEKKSLDASWRSLSDFGSNEANFNAISVIDGSGSMTRGVNISLINAALSLGIYFAEHSKGSFANHFRYD